MKAGFFPVLLFAIALPGLQAGCGKKNYASNQAQTAVIQTPQSNADQQKKAPEKLLFLSFTIKKTKPQNEVKLLNKIVSEGKMKTGWENTASPTDANFLQFNFLSSGDTTITYYLEHPLYKHVEVADAEGKLHRKDIELDSAEFFIRTPLLENLKGVQVAEKVTGKPLQQLLQFTL